MAVPRKFIVVGNFDNKMGVNDVDRLSKILRTGPLNPGTEVVISCPSYLHSYAQTHLPREVGIAVKHGFKFQKFTQSDQNSESFPMVIPSYSFNWVLLRDLKEEQEATIAQRVNAAMEADLKVIACLYETEDNRQSGQTQDVIFKQLQVLAGAISDWSRVVIVFEAEWMINKGFFDTSKQVEKPLVLVRRWLRNNVSDNVADSTRIIYGGSVCSRNCHELAKIQDLDGFFVGSNFLNFDLLQLANASRASHTHLLMKHQQIRATAQLIHGLRDEYFQFKSLQRRRCPKRYI